MTRLKIMIKNGVDCAQLYAYLGSLKDYSIEQGLKLDIFNGDIQKEQMK